MQHQPEPARVGVCFVAGYEEVLGTGRRERDEQPRFVAAHGQPMRHVLGQRGVGAGLDVDLLVADEGGDRAVEDVDGLVLPRVGMDRRLVAGAYAPLDDGPVAARLLSGDLEFGARAGARLDGTAS